MTEAVHIPSVANADDLCARAEAKAGSVIHDLNNWAHVYHKAVRVLNEPDAPNKCLAADKFSTNHAWARHMLAKYEPALRAFVGGQSVRDIKNEMSL